MLLEITINAAAKLKQVCLDKGEQNDRKFIRRGSSRRLPNNEDNTGI